MGERKWAGQSVEAVGERPGAGDEFRRLDRFLNEGGRLEGISVGEVERLIALLRRAVSVAAAR